LYFALKIHRRPYGVEAHVDQANWNRPKWLPLEAYGFIVDSQYALRRSIVKETFQRWAASQMHGVGRLWAHLERRTRSAVAGIGETASARAATPSAITRTDLPSAAA
jgi:hypothetical protein